jgi:uncharacterized membrane protein HdeD (DUF308 family)
VAKKQSQQKNTKTSKKTSSKVKSKDATVAPIVRRARTASWVAILEAIVVGVLGGLLVTNPDGILRVIFYVVGIFLIVKGVYKIVNYFAVHGKYDFYNNDLLYGIIALIFGILSVVLWEKLSGAIGLVVGAWMIYGSLVRMNTAIRLHAAGVKSWFYVLLIAMVMLALGIYMIISVGVVIQVIGWIMIAAAVLSVVDDAIFMRHLDAVKQ